MGKAPINSCVTPCHYHNKSMKRTIHTAILALTFFAGANAQVSEFHPGVAADGVNYYLPRTGIRADVKAIKVTYTPGEFAKYADRYLHIKNVKNTAETTWSLQNITVSPIGEPDTTKCFTVKMKDKSTMPMAQLTEDGVLVAVNTKVDLPSFATNEKTSTAHKLNAKKYMTAEILSATSNAKMAELVAQEIFDIRESKNAIKRGQADNMPKDGPSLKIVLDELDEQEDALTQLFVGYSDTLTVSECCTVVPDSEINKEILFRFSRKLGFVDVDDLAGEPYYISIKDLHTVVLPTEAEKKKRKIMGLVYNMPSNADVSIFSSSATLYNKDIPFGQFGTIDQLAPTLFAKGIATKVTFSHTTGALLHIEQ